MMLPPYHLKWFIFLLLMGVVGNSALAQGTNRPNPDSLLAVADRFLDEDEISLAVPILYELLQIKEIASHPHVLRRTFANLGYLYYERMDYDSSAFYYQKSMEMAEQQGDTLQITHSLRSKGMALGQIGLLSFAADAYLEAKRLATLLKNRELVAVLTNDLGILYQSAGSPAKSLDFYRESLTAWQQLNDSLQMGFTYNNIARAQLDLLQLDSSLFYNLLALSVKKVITEDIAVLGSTINNLGKTYLLIDSLDQAENFLTEGYFIHQKLADREGLIISLNNLTELALKRGEFMVAASHLDACRVLLADLDLKELLSDHLFLRSNYHELIGNQREALSDYKAYSELKSVLFEEQRLRVQEIESNYLLEDQRNQRQQAELEALVSKAESNRNLVIAVGLLLLAVILSFFAWKVWAAFKNEQGLKADIAGKNELIKLQKLDLKHRTKNLLHRIRIIISEASLNVNDSLGKEEFRRSERILISAALLEQVLYSVEDLNDVPICSYLTDLIEANKEVTILEGKDVSIHFSFQEEFLLPSQTVLDCGMILNELIMNSIKHAFHHHGSPEINISFMKNSDGLFELCYKDNGTGYSPKANPGIGSWVIESLLMSLKAKRLDDNTGTSCRIVFRSAQPKPLNIL